MPTMPCLDGGVILGVDTHADTHTAALIDPLGRTLATRTVIQSVVETQLVGRGDSRLGRPATVRWSPGRASTARCSSLAWREPAPYDLAAVAVALNTRPRKTLGWRTPAEVLNEYLAPAA